MKGYKNVGLSKQKSLSTGRDRKQQDRFYQKCRQEQMKQRSSVSAMWKGKSVRQNRGEKYDVTIRGKTRT